MKKILRRIVLLVLGTVLCYQHFCYADAIDLSLTPIEQASVIVIPIGIAVILITILSYFMLKVMAKKEQNINENTTKRINLDKKIIFVVIAIIIIMMILLIIEQIKNGLFFHGIIDSIIIRGLIMTICLVVAIVLILVSIIFRLKEKKKIAYIIMIIIIIIIGILATYSNILIEEAKKEEIERRKYVNDMSDYALEQYNSQFTIYEGDSVRDSTVRALYQAVLANNLTKDSEDRQVSISGVVTLNKEDTQMPEQINEISNQKTYSIKMIYNKYGKIESIHIEENQ